MFETHASFIRNRTVAIVTSMSPCKPIVKVCRPRFLFAAPLLFIAALATLAGCAPSTQEIIDAWMGRHKNELIAQYGPPTSVIDNGPQGQIWVYRFSSSYARPGSSTTTVTGSARTSHHFNTSTTQGSATAHTTTTPPRIYTYHDTWTVWISRSGRIYRIHRN